jgi:long-subunit acyl-CoA synthetase (AMP-forming)
LLSQIRNGNLERRFVIQRWLFTFNLYRYSPGAIAAGGFAAGIYTTNEPPACKFIAEHCAARVIVVEGQKQLDKILAIRAELPKLVAIVMYSGDVGLYKLHSAHSLKAPGFNP